MPLLLFSAWLAALCSTAIAQQIGSSLDYFTSPPAAGLPIGEDPTVFSKNQLYYIHQPLNISWILTDQYYVDIIMWKEDGGRDSGVEQIVCSNVLNSCQWDGNLTQSVMLDTPNTTVFFMGAWNRTAGVPIAYSHYFNLSQPINATSSTTTSMTSTMTATSTPTATSSPAASSSAAAVSSSSSNGVAIGAGVGGGIGGAIAVLGIAFGAWFCVRRRRKNANQQQDVRVEAPNMPPNVPPNMQHNMQPSGPYVSEQPKYYYNQSFAHEMPAPVYQYHASPAPELPEARHQREELSPETAFKREELDGNFDSSQSSDRTRT